MHELLKKRNQMHEIEVKCYAMQVILALEYFQSQKVIHRDVKLENLLLNGEMGVQLADFGLAIKLQDN